jgi:hypothetical protein
MQSFRIAALVGLTALATTGGVQAQENAAAKAFGAREMVQQASLSPDGKSVALIQPLAEKQANALFVGRLDGTGQPKPIFSASGRPDRLDRCDWASNTRLVCEVSFYLVRNGYHIGFSRLVALNADRRSSRPPPSAESTATSRTAARSSTGWPAKPTARCS